MISKSTSFARWSKSFCWVVAAGCLLIALATITGESSNRNMLALLWFAGAIAFTVSGIFLGKSSDNGEA
jgi:hypothetical protein